MKTLSEEEKNIIKLIQERKIVDIYSYIKHFELGGIIQIHKDEIKQKFDLKYGGKEYTVENINYDFLDREMLIEKIDNKTARLRPVLSYRKMGEKVADWNSITYKGIQYRYQITEPIFICENMEAILHFISVWQYLESEQLIIELPKSCEKHDMELFLRKDFSYDYSSNVIFEEVKYYHDLEISAQEFMDWQLKLDEHNFEICLPYLTKQIQPTLALDVFIHDRYKTRVDKNQTRNFMIALVGVIVAIITSGASILVSLWDKGNTKELQDINNSLQEIHNTLMTEEQQENNVEDLVSGN